MLDVLHVLLPGCETRGHALAVESLGPLLHRLLALCPKSVAEPGVLISVPHELVSCAAVDLLELGHLLAKFVLLLSHLEQGLLLPEVLPTAEGSILVVPVNALD